MPGGRLQVLGWQARMRPEITIVSAYAGQPVDWSKQHLELTLKTVSHPKGAMGFVAVPRRWIAERSPSRLTRARRNVRDYERLPQHPAAHLTWRQ